MDRPHQEALERKFVFRTFAGGPWYEEDEDWAAVAVAFPEHFSDEQLYAAVRIVQRDRSALSAVRGWEDRWADVRRYLAGAGEAVVLRALGRAAATAQSYRTSSLSTDGSGWRVRVRRGDDRQEFALAQYPGGSVWSPAQVQYRRLGIISPDTPGPMPPDELGVVGAPYGFEWADADPPTPQRLQAITGKENLAPTTDQLFHGTSADLYETLRHEGLRKAREWNRGREGIFVWEDFESALNWANKWYGKNGMVVLIDPSFVTDLREDLDAGNKQFAYMWYPTAPHVLRRMGATQEEIKHARSHRPGLIIGHDVPPEALHFYVGREYREALAEWRREAEEQGLSLFGGPSLNFVQYEPNPSWARRTIAGSTVGGSRPPSPRSHPWTAFLVHHPGVMVVRPGGYDEQWKRFKFHASGVEWLTRRLEDEQRVPRGDGFRYAGLTSPSSVGIEWFHFSPWIARVGPIRVGAARRSVSGPVPAVQRGPQPLGLEIGPELAAALNAAGLYHGSARLPEQPQAQQAIDEDGGNPYLAPFGGLYVTADPKFAAYYAEASRWRQEGIADRYNQGQETIHQITVLPGALIALDEDVFGNYDAAKHWEHNQPFWDLYGAYGITHELLVDAGLLDQFEAQVQAAVRGDDEGSDDEFMWDLSPDDFAESVGDWTMRYVEPVMRAWLDRYRVSQRSGHAPPQPPEFRVLNDRFVADPPLPPRSVQGRKPR